MMKAKKEKGEGRVCIPSQAKLSSEFSLLLPSIHFSLLQPHLRFLRPIHITFETRKNFPGPYSRKISWVLKKQKGKTKTGNSGWEDIFLYRNFTCEENFLQRNPLLAGKEKCKIPFHVVQ